MNRKIILLLILFSGLMLSNCTSDPKFECIEHTISTGLSLQGAFVDLNVKLKNVGSKGKYKIKIPLRLGEKDIEKTKTIIFEENEKKLITVRYTEFNAGMPEPVFDCESVTFEKVKEK